MSALLCHELTKIYGGRRVLDRVSLTASGGQRIGLVGENGAGKSTLLRLLAGAEEPDGGEVHRPADLGFLAQELPYSPAATIAGVLDAALAGVLDALRRLDELAPVLDRSDAALAEYGEVLEWAQGHRAWDADRRAELVLAGLGLGSLPHDRPLATLSGGQRTRLGLAALLVRRPAALLLDEPTNHLDDDAVDFLSSHLRELPGVIVLASHDRVFLDEVCTDICDLDPSQAGGLVRYGGNYSDYLSAKRAQRRRWEQAWAQRQDELAALRVSVVVTARRVAPGRPMRDRNKPAYDRNRGRVQSSVSSRVRNARHRLDELLADPVRKPPAPLRFAGDLTGAAADDGGPALAVRDVLVPGRLAVDRLDVPIGGRLLVTGPNGAGKSSLLAVLAGRLRPVRGTVAVRPGVRIGLLEQDTAFAHLERSAAQYYSTSGPHPVSLAELGLLAPAELERPVGELSVGQRRRLALALLIARSPDVLLLDEPTNHLSLTLVDELEDALRAAPGTIVIATHDRWQRRRWDGARLMLGSERDL